MEYVNSLIFPSTEYTTPPTLIVIIVIMIGQQITRTWLCYVEFYCGRVQK